MMTSTIDVTETGDRPFECSVGFSPRDRRIPYSLRGLKPTLLIPDPWSAWRAEITRELVLSWIASSRRAARGFLH